MAKEAVNVSNIDWTEYFASIVSVCPWSKAYWSKQKIDIQPWTGTILPLNEYVARVYTAPQLTAWELYNMMRRLNRDREEEFLYSHPKFKGHSTPVPVLIQQDYEILAQARRSLKQHKYKHTQSK